MARQNTDMPEHRRNINMSSAQPSSRSTGQDDFMLVVAPWHGNIINNNYITATGQQQYHNPHRVFTNGNLVPRPGVQFSNRPVLIGNGCQEVEIGRTRNNVAAARSINVASSHCPRGSSPSFTNFNGSSVAGLSCHFSDQIGMRGHGSAYAGSLPRIFPAASPSPTASSSSYANNSFRTIPSYPFDEMNTHRGFNAPVPPSFRSDSPMLVRARLVAINPTYPASPPILGTQGKRPMYLASTPILGTQGNNAARGGSDPDVNNPTLTKKRSAGRPPKSSYSSCTQLQKPKKQGAIHMDALSIQIGQWMLCSKTKHIDIFAKCYSGWKFFSWECLDYNTSIKKRILVEWKSITRIQILQSSVKGHETLRVMMNKEPRFGQETDITANVHTKWGFLEDFTKDQQASTCLIHELEIKTGNHLDAFKKVLRENILLRHLSEIYEASSSVHPPPIALPPQQFTAAITSISRPLRINDVAEAAEEEVLPAYNPLQIQNNPESNSSVSNINIEQSNVQEYHPSEWDNTYPDYEDGLLANVTFGPEVLGDTSLDSNIQNESTRPSCMEPNTTEENNE